MNLPLFSTNEENLRVELIKIETETAGKPNQGTVLVIFANQSKKDNFLWFEFVLHEYPVHDSTIRRDRVEIEVFGGIGVPSHFPDWVSVLGGSHVGTVNSLFLFVSDVEDLDGTVVITDSKKSR